MKNVLKAFSVIALVAVIGFSMAACADDDGGDGESWYTYNDSPDDGTSTIEMTRGPGNDSNKLTFTGDVWKVPRQTWGYAGWGTAPNGASLTAFRNADSFSFKCKGDGKKYWVQVVTSDVEDYNYHLKIFQTSTTEQPITINYSDLAQDPNWGVQKPFNKNNITAIEFHARAESNITGEGKFTVTMWDLKANGGSSSGGGGVKGKLTITGIPSKYNGKFAYADGRVEDGSRKDYLYGGSKIEWFIGGIGGNDLLDEVYYTPVAISDGKVEIPLYTHISATTRFEAYNGNGVLSSDLYFWVFIMNDGNPTITNYNFLARTGYSQGTFVNGSLTVQWDQGFHDGF